MNSPARPFPLPGKRGDRTAARRSAAGTVPRIFRVLPLPALLLALFLAGCDALQGGAAAPRPPATGDADRGLRLLAQYQCGSCHAIPEVPAAQGGIGPPLGAFGQRAYIAGQLPNVPATLARWIADPQALIPGTTMPDMGASEADARDMAAYLMTLQ